VEGFQVGNGSPDLAPLLVGQLLCAGMIGRGIVSEHVRTQLRGHVVKLALGQLLDQIAVGFVSQSVLSRRGGLARVEIFIGERESLVRRSQLLQVRCVRVRSLVNALYEQVLGSFGGENDISVLVRHPGFW